MARLLLALVLVGCGFQKSVGVAALGDDTNDAATGDDSGPTTFGPWSAPVPFPELTEPGTALDDPTLTGDMLEIYFDSDRDGTDDDIFVATRLTKTDPWGTPMLLALNTTSRESDPEVSADGLTLWFASDRNGGQGMDDLYIATRLSRSMPFGNVMRLANVNSSGADAASTTDAQRQRLMFWSTRSGGAGGADIYESTWSGAAWNTPARVAALNTSTNDYDPCLTPDGLTVFFDSDRGGGAGQQDLYVASRASPSSTFDAPQAIVELNTAARDMDPWLTPDLRTMVFASNRSGEYQIYVTQR